jgi:hypothetical protein
MKFKFVLVGPDDPDGRPAHEMPASVATSRYRTLRYKQTECGIVKVDQGENGRSKSSQTYLKFSDQAT